MEEEFKKLELESKWEEHFESILSKSRTHSFEVGDAALNLSLNRYRDVKPYDKCRVKLNRAKKTDYINASLVTVYKATRQYIITQGPLPDTIGHFWLMIWEQKSNVIVMLNRVLELEKRVKCEEYWPNSIGKKVHYEDVQLSVTLNSVKDHKHYIIREMTLEDDESKLSRTVLQFHYMAWLDYDQPDSPTSFLRLLTAIRKSGGLDKIYEPTVVHCSAGLGRSGTFCLIDSVLSMVESQGSTEGIDIVNTLLELRDYRMGLIQSPVQLRFAYMTIIFGIKILEQANILLPHISSIRDSTAFESKTQQQITNGSSANNTKKPSRRNRKRQNNSKNSNSNSMSIFKKHLLVEALDDIDSDSADNLFYDTMRPCPNLKKPRNSSPNDFNDDFPSQNTSANNGSPEAQIKTCNDADQNISAADKEQKLTQVIHSLLTGNVISTSGSSDSPLIANTNAAQTTDSVLLRRRERELRNQRLAEKTLDIKNRMKEEELKRERYNQRLRLMKKSAIFGGVAALVISSIVYLYFHGNSSS